MPNFYRAFYPGMMRGMMNGGASYGLGSVRGASLFGRLGNSIRALRGIHWGTIINNTSKTLGIVNQTIPIVKQVGPMMNNVKSMIRVASIFKDETDNRPFRRSSSYHHSDVSPSRTNDSYQVSSPKNDSFTDDYSPTFFVSS